MIRPLTRILFRYAPPALALATALVTQAAAQSTVDIMSHGGLPNAPRPGPPGSQQRLPPALPGASTIPNQAIPSDKLSTDMSPNDALFDAINRGDIADARDAISRGADLSARNVLGMTPLDLSIDLSRNNITFLMLSLRGAPPGAGATRTASAGGGGAARPGAAKVEKAPHAAAARAPKPTPVVAQAPPQRQQLVSSDPGRPAPQAGFLGFGGAPQQ